MTVFEAVAAALEALVRLPRFDVLEDPPAEAGDGYANGSTAFLSRVDHLTLLIGPLADARPSSLSSVIPATPSSSTTISIGPAGVCKSAGDTCDAGLDASEVRLRASMRGKADRPSSFSSESYSGSDECTPGRLNPVKVWIR